MSKPDYDFTPGPWVQDGIEVWAEGDCEHHPIHGKDYQNSSCRLGYELEANARLMAAAPELLEALQKAVIEMEGLPHSLGYEFTHLKEMRAIIAKATGGAK